jgi:gliding motility-associated-like protein
MNFSKKIVLFFLGGLLSFCLPLSAQFPNPADFNTATNATNTGTIPALANDLHWTVSMTGINGTYVPAVSVGFWAPGSYVISPYVNTNWICYPHTCSADPTNHSCNGNVDEYYRIIFNLPGSTCGGLSVSTPSAYCLTFDYFSDNWVDEIYVNGILSFSNPTANPYFSWGFITGAGKTVSLCNNWQPGSNTVTVHTKSGPGNEGFLAQANQTINTSANVLTANITSTNAACFGGTGTVSVNPSGATGIYSYSWIPSGGTGNTANLAAGTYSCIVTSGACTITKTVTITQPAALNLNISPSTTLCQGATTVFTVNGANTYTWNTGGTGPNLTASVAAIYSVTGTNINNCTATATVALNLDPVPVVSISGNTLICGTGVTTTLTASGANTYNWMPGNINNQVAIVGPPANTTYTVTGTNSFGCSNTATIDVITNNFNLTTGPPLTICYGQSATLTANGVTGYTWMPGNFTGQNYAVSPLTSGDYTVLGTVGSCTFSNSQFITVTPLPTVSINPNPPPKVCPGVPVTLNASGANSYSWLPGNFNSSSINITPLADQVYTVTGTTSGCSSQVTQLVMVAPGVNVSVSPPFTLCKGDIGTLTASGGSVYIWEPGAGTGNTYTIQPLQNTTYTVTASNGTCAASNTVNVSVNYVIADFVDNSINGNYYEFVEFTNLSVNSVKNFWYFTNQIISSDVNPKIQFDEPGTYVACLMTENAQGCLDTLCKVINIGCPEDALFIPNTFTPNEDGLNDIFRVSTLGQCIENFEMTVFDRWGEAVFSTKDLAKGWDGKIKGVVAKSDVYTYLVKYTMINKKAFSKSGHVTLMK